MVEKRPTVVGDGWTVSNEGWKPEVVKKGYQPTKSPVEKNPAHGGYQPISQKDNPANKTPPGKD